MLVVFCPFLSDPFQQSFAPSPLKALPVSTDGLGRILLLSPPLIHLFQRSLVFYTAAANKCALASSPCSAESVALTPPVLRIFIGAMFDTGRQGSSAFRVFRPFSCPAPPSSFIAFKLKHGLFVRLKISFVLYSNLRPMSRLQLRWLPPRSFAICPWNFVFLDTLIFGRRSIAMDCFFSLPLATMIFEGRDELTSPLHDG